MGVDPADRAAALGWADQVRRERDRLLADLGAGRCDLTETVAGRADPAIGRTRLLSVLEAVPGARKVGTRRRLADLDLDGSVPLGDLDDATAALVVREFGGDAP